MLTVQTFDTYAHAASALTDRARFLGGGTLLMRQVNYGDQSFDQILTVNDPNRASVHTEGTRLRIGAAVTMSDIIANSALSFLAPVARSVGGPAIRNMGTVGGNLFAPHPYGDFATALLALDATVIWADGREEAIETFFAGRDSSRGIVAAVSVERPAGDSFRYLKVSRVKPKGAAVMTIALMLNRQSGRLGDIRVAFGSMGPTPLRAKGAEAALNGVNLDETGIQQALGVATQGLAPVDDSLASAWYRNEVAPVHLKRLLLQGRSN